MKNLIGLYAVANSKGLSSFAALVGTDEARERYTTPSLIQDTFDAEHKEQNSRIRLQGLWFDEYEVDVLSKEDYPELYL